MVQRTQVLQLTRLPQTSHSSHNRRMIAMSHLKHSANWLMSEKVAQNDDPAGEADTADQIQSFAAHSLLRNRTAAG